MKRSFPPPAIVLVGALVAAAACTPNNSVKSGAPELIEFIIGQPSPPGTPGPPVFGTTVKADTPECVSGIASGMACLPMGHAADIADGGTFDADVPADGLCRDANDANAMNWCTCVAGADPKVGTWNCDPFGPVFAVIAVFDRLLDPSPFDAVDAGPITNEIVTTTASSGAPVISLENNYSATGSPTGLVFNLYGPFFGNLRGDGPSLLSAPQPEFPSGATVTVTIDKNMVHAKDGTTPFTGTGLLASGTLVFTSAPFSASVSPPDPMRYGADPNAAIVAFSNFVDPADAAPHIKATVDGTAAVVTSMSYDNANFLVTPMAGGGAWPTGATVVITVDSTVTNLLGQAIAPVAPFTFTAP